MEQELITLYNTRRVTWEEVVAELLTKLVSKCNNLEYRVESLENARIRTLDLKRPSND